MNLPRNYHRIYKNAVVAPVRVVRSSKGRLVALQPGTQPTNRQINYRACIVYLYR